MQQITTILTPSVLGKTKISLPARGNTTFQRENKIRVTLEANL